MSAASSALPTCPQTRRVYTYPAAEALADAGIGSGATILAAVSGIILVSRMNSGQPNAGQNFEISVVAGVILGGTSLGGGEGTLIGTLIGALVARRRSVAVSLLDGTLMIPYVIPGIVMGIAFIATGTMEFVREGIRKPWGVRQLPNGGRWSRGRRGCGGGWWGWRATRRRSPWPSVFRAAGT